MKFFSLLLLVAATVATHAKEAPALELEQIIPLPDVAGRIDHLTLDSAGSRLFVAALGNNTVEVIDLKTGKRTHTIRGLDEPQGIFYAADLGRLYVANGGDGALRIFEGANLEPAGVVPLSGDADNVRYDARTKQIVVGYGKGALAFVDTAKNEIVGTAPLSGHPESFQVERDGPRIFVNVPGSRHVAVVDRVSRKTTATWPTGALVANYPMALDEANHRLFAASRIPSRLLVFDVLAGRESAKLELHGDCDDLFWDAERKRLYASCGEGCLDIFFAPDADHVEKAESVATAPGARTCGFDGKRIYLAVPRRGKQDAEVRVFTAR